MTAPVPASPPAFDVYFDVTDGCLHVGPLRTSDKGVLREAARWSSGERGEAVSFDDLQGVDLSAFAREALSVGSRVIALVSQDGDTRAVRQAVKDASEQVSHSVERASQVAQELTSSASRASHETVRWATETMAQATRTVQADLSEQIHRLVGGENPELMERLRPILERVGGSLEGQIAQTLQTSMQTMVDQNAARHREVLDLVHDLRRDVAAHDAAKSASAAATAAVRGITTLKGLDYESQVNLVCADIATAMGDSYEETGEYAGALFRNKKGDGVLHVGDGTARVVVEAHDGTAKEWGSYLKEAERNRRASASIGFIRRVADNQGRVIRVVAPKRLVVAFDPDEGNETDVEVVRTVLMLMKAVALSSTSRFGVEEIATASDSIKEALAVIEGLDEAKKAASAIHTNATKIEQVIERSLTGVRRELHAAINALTGAEAAADQAAHQAAAGPADGPADGDGDGGGGSLDGPSLSGPRAIPA